MSNFPENTTIQLAREEQLQGATVKISGDEKSGFTIDIEGSVTWSNATLSSDGCSLLGGENPDFPGVTLEVTGSCSMTPGDTFLYLIGITRDASRPPDDHVVEWVAEDEG